MTITINEHIQLEVAGQNSLILYFSSNSQQSAMSLPNESANESANELLNELPKNLLQSPFKGAVAIEPAINTHVQQAAKLIRQHTSLGIIDLIPSYASILVTFNLLKTDSYQLTHKLQEVLKDCKQATTNVGKLVELPAYYALEEGVDLARIAKQANLSVEQVIKLHHTHEYQVYAVGFAPGFAYLGEVDSRIAMPRLTTPRMNVPKGAIAIADTQTAVYPTQSPGGWNIIGLCPTEMFNPHKTPSMPVEVGDRVKFVPIDKQKFLALGGELPSSKVSLV